MNKKNIVIIGLGGVGGYFGFKINETNRIENLHEVSFVARGETYQVVKEKGLTLISSEHSGQKTRPNALYQDILNIASPDLVLICVKEYDLEHVCKQLVKVISTRTILLPLMNGADIYERIRMVIPNNTILPSCVYVASHIQQKGIVEHKGKRGKLFLGRDPENFSENIDWIVDFLNNCGIDFDFKDSSLTDIWTKFIFIASFGLVTAKHNSSIGAVCNDEIQKKEAKDIMQEIKLLATAKGILLDKNIIPKTFEKASSFPPETPTSLQLDVNSKKMNNELELFAGAIITYGDKLNIKTPSTQKIYKEIRAYNY
ncbi:MAG: 2-dehydropantoate 2-reductase [Muricauda sp.]|uniref:ketopantoate reductase family protein n=1 Tax=Flagellimonas lutimaris TaxID=475082 RepID=UPI000C43728E|nr:2-dehydropantoate 2-reductase [uncultured Allomuricauda sp.]MBC71783.1 2-dehydropantoate 2-reductase [Allomuricauda sp.]|tara:strand:+ start:11465 stop:12406 length:942 start_codon:yes stop_codon:yes gene_type:complete